MGGPHCSRSPSHGWPVAPAILNSPLKLPLRAGCRRAARSRASPPGRPPPRGRARRPSPRPRLHQSAPARARPSPPARRARSAPSRRPDCSSSARALGVLDRQLAERLGVAPACTRVAQHHRASGDGLGVGVAGSCGRSAVMRAAATAAWP